ncbi:hypothetical protein VTK56DRAFT_1330 [Thermocarpiscus australiensis]
MSAFQLPPSRLYFAVKPATEHGSAYLSFARWDRRLLEQLLCRRISLDNRRQALLEVNWTARTRQWLSGFHAFNVARYAASRSPGNPFSKLPHVAFHDGVASRGESQRQ